MTLEINHKINHSRNKHAKLQNYKTMKLYNNKGSIYWFNGEKRLKNLAFTHTKFKDAKQALLNSKMVELSRLKAEIKEIKSMTVQNCPQGLNPFT